jgi:hypothetical protein
MNGARPERRAGNFKIGPSNMKPYIAWIVAIASGSCLLAAPERKLDVEAVVVPQRQISTIAAAPDGPLPVAANYAELQKEEAVAPAYVVVRIKDRSRGVA